MPDRREEALVLVPGYDSVLPPGEFRAQPVHAGDEDLAGVEELLHDRQDRIAGEPAATSSLVREREPRGQRQIPWELTARRTKNALPAVGLRSDGLGNPTPPLTMPLISGHCSAISHRKSRKSEQKAREKQSRSHLRVERLRAVEVAELAVRVADLAGR